MSFLIPAVIITYMFFVLLAEPFALYREELAQLMGTDGMII